CGARGGDVFGRMVRQQYGRWALVLFIMGFFMAGVNNWAHAGGFAGGFLSGLGLSLAERRDETAVDKLLAAVAILVTLAAFALALWTAFAACARQRPGPGDPGGRGSIAGGGAPPRVGM